MAAINIRACTQIDIDAVLALDREWQEEAIAQVFSPVSRDEVVANLMQFPAYFWVAESEDGVVGYINGSLRTGTDVTIIPVDESYVEIENLYVTIQLCHRQVGRQLIERLMEAAHQRGVERFLVSSDSKQMDKILSFYAGHGFKLWYVQMYK